MIRSFPIKNCVSPEAPIGVVDSGMGGLTLVRALQSQLPRESVTYVGDTAHFPYGNQSPEEVCQYVHGVADFLIDHGIKLLVLACNTATVHALDGLRERLAIPVLGVVEPAVREAAQVSQSGRIGVLATQGTIASGVYENKLLEMCSTINVCAVACPLLVPLAEEGRWQDPEAQSRAHTYLKPIDRARCDTVILGCTHFPLLKGVIQKAAGEKVHLIDSALASALAIKSFLIVHGLSTSKTSPNHRFFVSKDPQRFAAQGERFLGAPLPRVNLIFRQ